jgi:hypothetical protein
MQRPIIATLLWYIGRWNTCLEIGTIDASGTMDIDKRRTTWQTKPMHIERPQCVKINAQLATQTCSLKILLQEGENKLHCP